MSGYTVTPEFPSLHAGTEYDIRYRLNPWDPEDQVIGTLEGIRVAPLTTPPGANGGVPMVGIKPSDGRTAILVEFPWEAITRVGLHRDWGK